MVPCSSELPISIKNDFENLTMIEEMLVSSLLAIMSVYRLPGGALITRGFFANFVQYWQPLLTALPRLPKELHILILKRVERVLRWLCANNPVYVANNIKSDDKVFNLLPDDSVPHDLNTVDDTAAQNIDSIFIDNGQKMIEHDPEFDYEAFVESDDTEPL